MPAVPLSDLLTSGTMVKVFVGPKRKEWTLHEDVICHHSEFFRKVFRGCFKEGFSKELYLDEDDPAAFGHVVDWLYGVKMACTKSHKRPVSWDHVTEWCQLYVLADKLGLDKLMEDALDIYSNCKGKRLVDVEDIEFAYQRSPKGSQLRTLICDEVVHYFMNSNLDDYAHWAKVIACNASFAEDFAKAVRDHVRLPTEECTQEGICAAHDDRVY